MGAFLNDINYSWVRLRTEYCTATETASFPLRVFAKNLMWSTEALILIFLCSPRFWSPLATIGQHSIYPYMLHTTALVLWARFRDALAPWPLVQEVVWHSGPLVLAWFLTTKPVRVIFG